MEQQRQQRQQIPAYPDKKSISDLIGKIRREELVLQPEFQRKFVWTALHMESFIDTILKGYPFPEIYISQRGIDLETQTTQNVVVDGQQRLTTIQRYIDGSGGFEKIIPKYQELSGDQQKAFLNYDVVIRDLKGTSPEVMIEIFRRINSVNFALNKVEINNAVYSGEFISCAKDILDKVKECKLFFAVFSESKLTRMLDLDLILLFLATIEEGGYFAGDTKVEEYIARYDGNYPRREDITKSLSQIIEGVLQSDLKGDSIWLRKSNFFTVIVEFYKAEKFVIDNDLLKKMNSFEEEVLANKNGNRKDNEFASYYSRMYAGTTNRESRVIRGDLFRKHVIMEQ